MTIGRRLAAPSTGAWGEPHACMDCHSAASQRQHGQRHTTLEGLLSLEQCKAACEGHADPCAWISYSSRDGSTFNGTCTLSASCDAPQLLPGRCMTPADGPHPLGWWTSFEYAGASSHETTRGEVGGVGGARRGAATREGRASAAEAWLRATAPANSAPAASTGDDAPQAVPDMLCAGFPRSGGAAVLLTGLCRSFSRSVYHGSLKRNLVDSLGSGTRVFVAISAGRGEEQQCQRALDVLQPAWQLPIWAERQGKREVVTPPIWTNQRCRVSMLPDLRGSFLAQFAKKHMAWTAMQKYEDARGERFSWVFSVRPDLVYPRPLPPICFFNASAGRMYQDRGDSVLAVPRQDAGDIINAWAVYHRCNETLPIADPEKWLMFHARRAGYEMHCNGNAHCADVFAMGNLFAGTFAANDHVLCGLFWPSVEDSPARQWCDHLAYTLRGNHSGAERGDATA